MTYNNISYYIICNNNIPHIICFLRNIVFFFQLLCSETVNIQWTKADIKIGYIT